MNEYLSSIHLDKTQIEQSLLNIEKRDRTSLFAWNGQFSPQFIEVLLDKYSDANSVVYDPFVGSGTVLNEAARKNLCAYGVELNPAAYYMANINRFARLDQNERERLLEDASCVLKEYLEKVSLASSEEEKFLVQPDQKNDLISLLVIISDFYKNGIVEKKIKDNWVKLEDIIRTLPKCDKGIHVYNSDCRFVEEISDDAANLVISSPPYINVINYHQQYRRSVEALGYDVLKVAKNEFGSNRANRSNRFYTVVQYCIDIAEAILETSRIVKDGSRMIFIVGRESRILKIPFCNSNLLFQICRRLFSMDLIMRQERVFTNRFGKKIYEDILHVENKETSMDIESIEDGAKRIAIEALYEGLDYCGKTGQPKTTQRLIHKAIEKAPELRGSGK